MLKAQMPQFERGEKRRALQSREGGRRGSSLRHVDSLVGLKT